MPPDDIATILRSIENLGAELRVSIGTVHIRLDDHLKDCRDRHNGTNLQNMDGKIDTIQENIVRHLAASGGERDTSRNWLNIMLAVGMLIVTAISAYGAFAK